MTLTRLSRRAFFGASLPAGDAAGIAIRVPHIVHFISFHWGILMHVLQSSAVGRAKPMLAFLFAVATLLGAAGIAAAELPSGERTLGKTVIEPGYDDETGKLIYIMTPEGAPLPSLANAHAVSPLYLIVYPHSAANAVGTMNCAHEGGDNCPDHGLGIADLAQANVPGVYGNGVWGHDHIMDGPGGSNFNVVWKVVVVLFTNATAANEHITTEAQLFSALDRGDAMTVDPSIVFNCNLVSPATYARATPIAPVIP